MSKPETMMIDDVKYVREDSINKESKKLEGKPYVLVRGDRSGIFVGYAEEEVGKCVVLHKARRLWYWDGAASISQLAKEGVANPSKCKFPCEVTKIKILDAIEIIDVTEKARLNISEVAIWEK